MSSVNPAARRPAPLLRAETRPLVDVHAPARAAKASHAMKAPPPSTRWGLPPASELTFKALVHEPLEQMRLQVRQKTQQAINSPVWGHMVQVSGLTAGAAMISIAVGLASAYFVSPFLLSLTLIGGPVTQMFNQMPVIGPLLTGLNQRGGPFGGLATGLVMWFATRAMQEQGSTAQRQVAWASCAAAVGFAISPLFVPTVPVTGALAAGCLLGTLSMAFLTSRAMMPQTETNWRVTLVTISLGVGFATMAAQAAMLMPPAAIIGEALLIPITSCVGIAVHALYASLAPLWRVNVSEVSTLQTNLSDAPRADRPGEADPTLFGSRRAEAFLKYMDNAGEEMAAKIRMPTRLVVLQGPDGVGKRSLALAELRRLGVPIEMPSLEVMRQSASPAAAVMQFFDRCKERARITERPVAIFFKDINQFFPITGSGDVLGDQMTNRALLDTEPYAGERSDIIVIGTLRDGQQLDNRLMDRAVSFKLPALDAETLGAIVQSRLNRSLRVRAPLLMRNGEMPTLPALSQEAVAELGEVAAQHHLTGRHMSRYAEQLADGVQAAARVARQANVPFDIAQALNDAHAASWLDFLAAHARQEAP